MSFVLLTETKRSVTLNKNLKLTSEDELKIKLCQYTEKSLHIKCYKKLIEL